MFSSEKVLQMSYANYQCVPPLPRSAPLTDARPLCRGKEALVEKFKNSCIMDEREAWRPKIFHSAPGPAQGLPAPFPAPTHLRRKERGAASRGALYVPGVTNGGSGGGGTHHLHNVSHRAQRAAELESVELDAPAGDGPPPPFRPKRLHNNRAQ